MRHNNVSLKLNARQFTKGHRRVCVAHQTPPNRVSPNICTDLFVCGRPPTSHTISFMCHFRIVCVCVSHTTSSRLFVKTNTGQLSKTGTPANRMELDFWFRHNPNDNTPTRERERASERQNNERQRTARKTLTPDRQWHTFRPSAAVHCCWHVNTGAGQIDNASRRKDEAWGEKHSGEYDRRARYIVVDNSRTTPTKSPLFAIMTSPKIILHFQSHFRHYAIHNITIYTVDCVLLYICMNLSMKVRLLRRGTTHRWGGGSKKRKEVMRDRD